MAFDIVQDEKVFFGGYNMTSSVMSYSIEANREPQDDTTLGDGTRSNLLGLRATTASLEGHYDADPYDNALNAAFSLDDTPFSMAMTGTQGELAYFFNATLGDYSPISGSVGEIKGYSAGAVSRDKLIRGVWLLNGAGLSATGDGTAYQVGAVAANQKLYIATHLYGFDDAGDGISIEIESDASDDFTGSETTQATIAPSTALTSVWTTVDGAITDTWYRPVYTISGSTPSFNVAVFIGVG